MNRLKGSYHKKILSPKPHILVRRLPRGPIAGCLEVSCAGRLEVPGDKL